MAEFKVESFTETELDLNVKAGTKAKVSNIMSSTLKFMNLE